MKSNDVTVTDARMKELFRKQVTPIINDTVPKMVSQAVDTTRFRMGSVTKFYPYLDKAEVKLDNIDKTVLCHLPHRFVGSLIDFYTPIGDEDYCEKLHEPCILPRDPLYCFVVSIHDDDSEDYFLVSYYHSDEIIGFTPASPGSMKISNFRASCEDYIEFGGDGLRIQTKNPIENSYGEYEDNVIKQEYVNQVDVYTKSEVDALISDKLNEALESLNKQNNNEGEG